MLWCKIFFQLLYKKFNNKTKKGLQINKKLASLHFGKTLGTPKGNVGFIISKVTITKVIISELHQEKLLLSCKQKPNKILINLQKFSVPTRRQLMYDQYNGRSTSHRILLPWLNFGAGIDNWDETQNQVSWNPDRFTC